MLRLVASCVLLFSLFSCTSNEVVTDDSDSDLAIGISGAYTGVLQFSYSDFPEQNASENAVAVVTYEDENTIDVNTQGGDSFVATVDGSSSYRTYENVLSGTGIFNASSIAISGGYSYTDDGDISMTFNTEMPYTKGGTLTVTFQGIQEL